MQRTCNLRGHRGSQFIFQLFSARLKRQLSIFYTQKPDSRKLVFQDGRCWLEISISNLAVKVFNAVSPVRCVSGDEESSTPSPFETYCETESFNASCDAPSDVILMTYARYGRMRLSRCAKIDYGHIGCAADVLELADSRCSGRKSCEIAIPDALFAKSQPCPEDLKPYLEVGYQCVAGEAADRKDKLFEYLIFLAYVCGTVT